MNTEIELRAMLTATEYERVSSYLESHGESLGEDDKLILFYVLPGKLLKVVRGVSTDSAKISLKLKRIGEGSAFPELEVEILPEQFQQYRGIFGGLGFHEYVHTAFNRRTNFRFRDVAIALKWSIAWGFHAELERVLPHNASQEEVQYAEKQVRSVAEELGIAVLSEEELRAFTVSFEAMQEGLKRGELTSLSESSLVRLAHSGKAPLEQYMDKETLLWLYSQKPKELNGALPLYLDSETRRTTTVLHPLWSKEVLDEWLLVPSLKESLHGTRHSKRTLLYTQLLASQHNLTLEESTLLGLAALLHDTQRLDDQGDPGHGVRAAQWVFEHQKQIEQAWEIKLSNGSVELLTTIIKHHEGNLAEIPSSLDSRSRFLIDIFRTADALDRFRMPKVKWWMKKEYLSIVPSNALVELAFDLTSISEELHLAGYNSSTAVTTAAQILSLFANEEAIQ